MAARHLITDRLMLLPSLEADASFIASLIANESVRQYLGGPVPLLKHPTTVASYLNIEKGEAIWTIKTKELMKPIGLVSVTKHKNGTDFELSYQFHPTSWGYGFATEAAISAKDYAVNKLGHERLIAETQTANTASCHLLEKLGMKRAQTLTRFGAEQAIYTT